MVEGWKEHDKFKVIQAASQSNLEMLIRKLSLVNLLQVEELLEVGKRGLDGAQSRSKTKTGGRPLASWKRAKSKISAMGMFVRSHGGFRTKVFHDIDAIGNEVEQAFGNLRRVIKTLHDNDDKNQGSKQSLTSKVKAKAAEKGSQVMQYMGLKSKPKAKDSSEEEPGQQLPTVYQLSLIHI